MSNVNLTAEQQAFVDEFASLLLHWGMSIASARLYAYLLLVRVPVSLDEFAEALGISKSNASTAARELETSRIVRRLTERGSKRIRYEVSSDPGVALMHQTELLGRMANFIDERVDAVATGECHTRLIELRDFHRSLKLAMETAIDKHRAHALPPGPQSSATGSAGPRARRT